MGRHHRAMNGIDAQTGRRLSGIDHLRQSVRDILSTPIGSRVMRRDYGSRLPSLIDAPINRSTMTAIYAATVEALGRWEPRISVERVSIAAASPGRVTLDIEGVYRSTERPVLLDGIEVG